MTVLLAIAVGLASLASLLTFVLALGLGRSDPAGNGLAQAYVAIATAVTTGLVAIATLLALGHTPPAWPGSWIVTLGLAALALAIPATALPAVFASSRSPRRRQTMAAMVMTGQQAVLLHAAWRGLAVPLPPSLAVSGCAVVAGLAVLVPWLAPRRRRPTGVFAIAYPALVVRTGNAVRVVRGADELTALGPTFLLQPPPAATIDANGTVWTVRPAAALAGWTASPAPSTLPIEAVRAQVLAIPRLHADPARDAELRRLVASQRDVTALSFVLPKST